MVDLEALWLEKTGEIASNEVSIEFSIENTACCDMCADSYEVSFYITCASKRVMVYDSELGIERAW